MIQGLFNTGSMPVLERMVQFTSQRHELIAHNVANLSTPNFRPSDLSVSHFQQALGEAIDQRRSRGGVYRGDLDLRDSSSMRFGKGWIEARAGFSDQNILFHDRNNRSVERLMQNLAENALAHNGAIQMLRNQFTLLETAIRERV